MDWSKYGKYDLPAAVKVIQERTGVEKVAIVGHSQGTTQTFAGMGEIPEWYDENISISALLGPCTSPNEKYFKDVYTPEVWSFLADNDIYVIAGGPDWDAKLELIQNDSPQIMKDTIGSLLHLPNNPVQALAAYAQTSLTGRFQKYDPDWFSYLDEHDGAYPKTELMDFGLVNTSQVALYIGLFDNTCPLTVASEIATQLGEASLAHYVVAPWQGHVPWGFSGSPWFINDLSQTLQLNQ